ncbi:HDOD domain-containing protein [Pseudomonas massiliensis]|uniref:HDOD domain-containing protein n=1 Tax=Pseudomonas massiliensis TaxID=522492 RepID=UPI0006941E22|nr:HDOD domain-containing protein [Pseudomonas massiliensis]
MAEPLNASPRVLIAESEPWSRDLLTQLLLSVRCDAKVTLCENGAQALAALDEPADLIIASRELPGTDGLELLRQVRRGARAPGLPFILLSSRGDSTSVRETLALTPTAYLTKPLNFESLRERLSNLLLEAGEAVVCEVPPVMPGIELADFLEMRREASDGAPIMTEVYDAVVRSIKARSLNLRALEAEIRSDPQVTAVLLAAANSAARHREEPANTLLQALSRLGANQSMNLILGLALKRSARLDDPLLAEYAQVHWKGSLATAELARALARQQGIDAELCYCAGLLHRLGELALLRTLMEWKLAGGSLQPAQVEASLQRFGANFGSALRARWRLPHDLRDLIASVYALMGVYGRPALVMNIAGQLANLPAEEDVTAVAQGKAARLLGLDAAHLAGLRKAAGSPRPAAPTAG